MTEDMAAELTGLRAESKCEYLFTSLRDHSQPLTRNTLANQHRAIMKTCRFHPDAGLHALRHPCLTEVGRYTQNPKALQRFAGHAQIQTTMRHIHPDQSDVLEMVATVQRKKASQVTTVFTTVGKEDTQQTRKM